MKLKSKFILLIGLVIGCSYGVTFYRTSAFQEQLVVEQATHQAKMLFDQIRITRQWVADHNGLFLVQGPGVGVNPFLIEGKIQDREGNWLVKRNPAMVTRELSAYATREGMGQFNVTSLKPLNPENQPDDFERRSLEHFADGRAETVEIEKQAGAYRLRYMAPLLVTNQCLTCHGRQGYEVGDIRGGMSVSIPMDWAYTEIHRNNRQLLQIALITILVVSLAIYLLFNLVVSKRLNLLAEEMDSYPTRRRLLNLSGSENQDEIGALALHFRGLCDRLDQSQRELDATREQVFQSEKLASLGRLVAGLAHEINNPLGGMQNCLQTMKRSLDQPDLLTRYLELLGQGVGRIKGTVQQLLNIGRKEPLELQCGDVDQLVRDAVELSCMGRRQVEQDLHLAVGRPLMIGMEALRQVLLNLVGNALQAIGDSNGVLRVQSEILDSQLRITVSDSGPGIPPENLDKIFDPFFTTKEVGEGTGLGLSVSHSLMTRMGGELRAANRPGGGAVFTLLLPLDECHADESGRIT